MKKIFIAILILAILLIFAGCAKQTQKTETETKTTSDTGGKSNDKSIDLTNINTLRDLLLLGKGMICDVNTEYFGRSLTLKYYIAPNKYRVEGTTNDGNFIVIRPNDGYVYMKPIMQGPTPFNCEWFKIKEENQVEINKDAVETKTGSVNTPIEKIKWKCYETGIDNSKFLPPPNACDLEEIFSKIGQGWTPNFG
ncbi:MAG: hypothetical protein QXQ30_02505 [Candidatus Pacearchaeota archaeon]